MADTVADWKDRVAYWRDRAERAEARLAAAPAFVEVNELARQRILRILRLARESWKPAEDRLAAIEHEAEHFTFTACHKPDAAGLT